MKVAIAQRNFTVGDIDGNLRKIKQDCGRAAQQEVDLVVFSEMSVTGYPPRDLLEQRWLLVAARRAVAEIAAESKRWQKMGIVLGAPVETERSAGTGLYNGALWIHHGAVKAVRPKGLLPTYDVFDETRYFDPAAQHEPVFFQKQRLGLTICEDALSAPGLLSDRLYGADPVKRLADRETDVFINISASPFHVGKDRMRFECLAGHAQRYAAPFVYVNQVGGNDELVFDGRSFVLDAAGRPLAVLRPFEEDFAVVDLTAAPPMEAYPELERVASIHDALVLGLRDYLNKCGFNKVVCGLSGGIDSAVTSCLAVSAVGPENVLGIAMPSPYSAPESAQLARRQAHNQQIAFLEIPIGEPYAAMRRLLAEPLDLPETVEVTQENIQARLRGILLMAFSNRNGYLLLSTGNKSELAVGYCTLYGDMTGGLAVLSDVPKTVVYELAAHINRRREIIPRRIIERPPSAELRPDQKDQDSLPAYPVLDEILRLHLEKGLELDQITARGFSRETVRWTLKAVQNAEYKRRQAAPGLKVTTKAFGSGRRMPIAAAYPAYPEPRAP